MIECRDALAFPGRRDTAVLLRRIEAVAGDAVVDVVLQIGADFGRGGAQHVQRLDHVRERVHVARVGLAGPKVLVLKLKFRIGKRARLLSQAFGHRDALRLGLQRRPRRQRPVHGVPQAQCLLRSCW